ncbi:efflux RND transporter periplasmic adaptor subunit [Laribacter hongkongensis]|uniref:Efflux RND transporter periplasmic adaptor subunit n=1 Tax=Laribacter hongkongensis TaxID=168471 RepID=A0ABD4SML3_9NEIS|nr:efflux RND transporter periplasmic adaptor subunit [Laribacter hongkongensis]MCG9024401.1 efflux RND transporter periplasmic adaptor subunit [Laribacter hongkongensis]MCG9099243.1 efflux RND transporter periplasmic adaptor subunit [Laribacter hongkongensis]MCG9103058.1 efflux RND transporter periplasmic adaptor subunit [Laribacter hongkongensis]MCG9111490.1 efflux RND transporter periplasmic adaptor subunit [Laribacter hongkongensis]MCG9117291.1 efflux RND transporter periplasmic adaptor su
MHRPPAARWSPVVPSCVLTALLLAGCNKPAETPAVPPQVVKAMTVTRQDVPIDFPFVATTESSQNVEINARVTGYLERKTYDEGGTVKKGQTLFVLDQKPFLASLESARAQLANSRAALETARLNLRRYQALAPRGAASQSDLDNATGSYQQAQASVKAAEASVQQAELNLGYTVITSPVDGVAGLAIPAIGTYIGSSNSNLTTVATLNPMWIKFSVSEGQVQAQQQAVRSGSLLTPADGRYQVEILRSTGEPYDLEGVVTTASPFYDNATGTFVVRATVNNSKGMLRPNQYVNIRLKGAVRPGSIVLPQRAVQQGPGSQYVWVVGKDNTAEYRPVTVGPWQNLGWLIQNGLEPGEKVVVEGLTALRPGAPMKVSQLSPAELAALLGEPAPATPATPAAVPAAKLPPGTRP